MKCDLIQMKIADLFDDQMSPEEKQEWLSHIGKCEDCREAYEDFLALATSLRPDLKISDGEEQINKILTEIEKERTVVKTLRASGIVWHRILRVAATIVIVLGVAAGIIYLTTFRNPVQAAGSLLEKSIRAMISLKSVYMVFAVRTYANENFESIDQTAGFIDFKIWKEFGTEPKWRFDKPGRSIIMDGQSQYQLNQSGGYVLKGAPEAGFVGWMKMFLEPMKILETELSFARSNPSFCTVKEKGDQLELTVKATAQGNFSNPYALNATIPEANTRRVYLFDKDSHMLKALSVYVESEQEDICVLKLTEITVDPTLPDSLFVFGNRNGKPVLTLEEWDQAAARGLKDISSEEAVRIFLTACGKNDWKTVQRFSPLFSLPGSNTLKIIQSRFAGSRLLGIGTSFTSGIYAGVYVPYIIQIKSGATIEGNMAIRKDNPYQTWNIDGGY